jgi:putative transposase
MPGNAQAKIAERTFADLRAIDDRPEFSGAHAGHAAGARPESRTAPVALDVAEAVIRREVNRYDAEGGRRGRGIQGRSCREAFDAGLAGRIVTRATARQLWLAGLDYRAASVDRHGRLHVGGWSHGGPETQAELLDRHGKGQIVIGRDPDDHAAAAVAFAPDGRLVREGIAPVKRHACPSADGARGDARNRATARKKAREAEAALDCLSDAATAAALADLPDPGGSGGTVGEGVAGRFGGPPRPAAAAGQPAPECSPPLSEEERTARLDACPARRAAEMTRARGV